jgi:hypothetical protein
MLNTAKNEKSLFSRTFTKEEALARSRYLLVENSDVPADRISIKNAVDRAIAEMEEQLDFYSRTRKD